MRHGELPRNHSLDDCLRAAFLPDAVDQNYMDHTAEEPEWPNALQAVYCHTCGTERTAINHLPGCAYYIEHGGTTV